MTAAHHDRILANVASIRARIAAATQRALRAEGSVRLVAVTKQASRTQIESLLRANCLDLAESRPQQLWQRAAWFPSATWHLVGNLQRNKVDQTLPVVRWIHSVDSDRLLDCLQQRSSAAEHVSLLLQVNISQEPSKHGWRMEQMPLVCESLAAYPDLEIRGFMGMASLDAPDHHLHREFASLRVLAEQLRSRGVIPPNCHELSMGMSQDFEIAIEEGATMVRIGSALFEGALGTA